MPRVLVLSMANWLGSACLPRALHRAGFDVSLMCYPNTLISLTKFADDRETCTAQEPGEVVARRLAAMIQRNPVRLMIAADDHSTWYMRRILEVAGKKSLPKELVDLVAESLPDLNAFQYGDNKQAASDLMESLGLRTPTRSQVSNSDDLVEFASRVGLPVVLKPTKGLAGDGVHIFQTEQELSEAVISGDRQWIAQQYIVGKPAGSASVALKGKWIGTVAYEKTWTHPGEAGPASVVTRIDCDEIERGAVAFAKATNYTGFYSPGYMIEKETGDPYFIEVNMRCVPVVSASGKIGLDLCAGLYAKLVGAPTPKMDPSAPRVLALYPQELLRDPESPYREHLLDEPTDDPLLHQAMQEGVRLEHAETAGRLP